MHSTQMTRVAQAADNFGFSVVALIGIPKEEGVYATALCLLVDDSRPEERAYAVGTCVLPDEVEAHYGGERVREAWFQGVHYDLSPGRGREVFADRLVRLPTFGEVAAV